MGSEDEITIVNGNGIRFEFHRNGADNWECDDVDVREVLNLEEGVQYSVDEINQEFDIDEIDATESDNALTDYDNDIECYFIGNEPNEDGEYEYYTLDSISYNGDYYVGYVMSSEEMKELITDIQGGEHSKGNVYQGWSIEQDVDHNAVLPLSPNY